MITTTKSHIRFDWAAKKILRSKANFGILEGFLSELLEEDITIKSLLSEESNKETQDDKSNRVDILIENSKGEISNDIIYWNTDTYCAKCEFFFSRKKFIYW